MSSSTMILIVMPILVLQLALQIYALYDLWSTQRTTQINWLWVVVIVIGGLLGPLVYFVFGRRGVGV
jgi:phosphate/sulfate permease